MTNHWIDIKHADVILCIGSNPAENHPISFRWVEKAMDNGAKLISVDPRYTRTSSKSDIYAQLRPGTDIAFIGGLINYALQNNSIHKEYVVNYTNAAFLVAEDFSFNDGLFSGYDAERNRYDNDSWAYQLGEDGLPLRVIDYLVSTQHTADVTDRQDEIREYVREDLAPRALDDWYRADLTPHVNPTGSFEEGGPSADSGMTGKELASRCILGVLPSNTSSGISTGGLFRSASVNNNCRSFVTVPSTA